MAIYFELVVPNSTQSKALAQGLLCQGAEHRSVSEQIKIPIYSRDQAGQECNDQQDTIINLTENDLGAFTVISGKISLAGLSGAPRCGRGGY